MSSSILINKKKHDFRACNLRRLIAKKAGLPLLRKLNVIPDRHLETLAYKYKYEIKSIKCAIMHDEWC